MSYVLHLTNAERYALIRVLESLDQLVLRDYHGAPPVELQDLEDVRRKVKVAKLYPPKSD